MSWNQKASSNGTHHHHRLLIPAISFLWPLFMPSPFPWYKVPLFRVAKLFSALQTKDGDWKRHSALTAESRSAQTHNSFCTYSYLIPNPFSHLWQGGLFYACLTVFNGFRTQPLKMYKGDGHRMSLLWIFYEQVWVRAVCLKQKTAQFATRAGSVLCLVLKASEKSWARKTAKQRCGRDTTI